MLLLCLIAALSGTPLRQAEAAGDFARAWVDVGPGHVETIDDGVGDDADVAILKDGGDAPNVGAILPPTAAEPLSAPPRLSMSSTAFGQRCPIDPAAALPPGSARRHAWLQCFLF
jgi:hypothetical protein